MQRLGQGGAILGVFAHWQYEEEEIHFNPGDRILMYTDGVTESHNAEGEEFGENQLIDLIYSLPGADAAELTEKVINAATRFSNGNFEDDLTVLGISIS